MPATFIARRAAASTCRPPPGVRELNDVPTMAGRKAQRDLHVNPRQCAAVRSRRASAEEESRCIFIGSRGVTLKRRDFLTALTKRPERALDRIRERVSSPRITNIKWNRRVVISRMIIV